MHRSALLVFVVVGLALAASGVSAYSPPPLAAGTPSISIISPTPGSIVSTAGTRILVSVSSFNLTSNTTCVRGNGHYVIWANNVTKGMSSDLNSSVWNLPRGPLYLGVQLVCGNGSPLTPQAWSNVTVVAGDPQLRLLSPSTAGGIAAASTVGLRVIYTIANFTLDSADYGGPAIPGFGHVHFYLDGSTTLYGTSVTNAFDTGQLAPGAHTILIELHNNDHSLVTTTGHPFGFNLSVALNAVEPSLLLLSPSSGTGVSASGFQVRMSVAGFALDPNDYGGANVPGQGHIHVYLDGTSSLYGTAATETFNVGSLSLGAHSILVQLHNNDHSLVTTAAHPFGINATVSVVVQTTGIRIVSPSTATISTLGTRIVVSVTGFILDAADYGGTAVPGEGHIHFYLDNTNTLIGTSTSPVFDSAALPAGSHTIIAELHNNDHTPLSPPVMDSIAVTVVPPSLTVLAPVAGSSVSDQGFRIRYAVAGFTLDPADYGGASIPGTGHLHFYLDGSTNLYGTSVTNYFDIGSLTPGQHTIKAELHNNDHSLVTPIVSQNLTIVAGPPTIAITNLPAGASVSSLGFRVEVAIANFSMDPADYGGSNIPGLGHWHLNNATSLLAATAATRVIVTGQPLGSLTLTASLHNNNHSSLAPAVSVSVSVNVVAPSISLATPTVEPDGTVLLSWTVTGFVIDSAAFGGAPEAGRGHVHVFVDGTYVTATAGSGAVLTGLSSGMHTIKVELFNNDHSALSTVYAAQATVTVSTGATSAANVVNATVFYATTGILAAIVVVLAALLARKGRGRRPPTEEPNEGQDGTR